MLGFTARRSNETATAHLARVADVRDEARANVARAMVARRSGFDTMTADGRDPQWIAAQQRARLAGF